MISIINCIDTFIVFCRDCACLRLRRLRKVDPKNCKIHQRGVQWKQGVVISMRLYTTLLYNTTPIHYTPLPLHPL